MHGSHHPKFTPLEKVLIAILCVLCVASFVWFFIDVETYSREGDLRAYRHNVESAQPRENIPVTSIKTWMTFDYLNVVFQLKPSYLQEKLDITDSHYPNIRIDSYARRHDLNADALLQLIQQLITERGM